MAMKMNPGIVIAIFLNVILLCGLPFFGEGEASRLAPLIVLALVWPWVMYFIVSRIITFVVGESSRRRQEKENSDFV